MLSVLLSVLISLSLSLFGLLITNLVYEKRKKKMESLEKNKKRKSVVKKPLLLMPFASSVVAFTIFTIGICVILVLNLFGINI